MTNDVLILLRCQKGCAKFKTEPNFGNLKEIKAPTLCLDLFCQVVSRKLFFFEFLGYRKFYIVFAIIFLLCKENLNNCRTWLQKLFMGGNYSKEETIREKK